VLDILARRYCPLPETYEIHYNWSIMQVEYAMDTARMKLSMNICRWTKDG